jgi:AraC family transcriptional regulator
MNMEARIETLTERKLVGKRMKMTFADNQTPALWQSFMPRRKEIQHNVGDELYSLQVYPPSFFEQFNPHAEFEKWAAIQVTGVDSIPPEFEIFTLPAGLYAVFTYRGTSQAAAQTFQYIYGDWVPNSEYHLDDRPHFELLGAKYQRAGADSEEEFWIPVKPK